MTSNAPPTAAPPGGAAAADPRYPVGRFTPPTAITADDRARWTAEVNGLPAALRAAVRGLDAAQMATPYRDGGWTLRQLVHHVADSHVNAYTRFKLALTEDAPTIKPYAEARWAELPDVAAVDPEVSLALLEAVHTRWAALLRAMTPADFERPYHHPESGRLVPLGEALATYAWHSRHHVAHVTRLREREGW